MNVQIVISGMLHLKNIEINSNENKFVFNGVDKDIDINNFCKKLASIVTNWEENMNLGIMMDLEKYSIVFKNNDGRVKKYCGNAYVPANYKNFLDLIKEVENAKAKL